MGRLLVLLKVTGIVARLWLFLPDWHIRSQRHTQPTSFNLEHGLGLALFRDDVIFVPRQVVEGVKLLIDHLLVHLSRVLHVALGRAAHQCRRVMECVL